MASTDNDHDNESTDNDRSSYQDQSRQVVLLEGEPPFYESLHSAYICGLATKLDSPSSYEGAVTEHLRMSGVYWSLTALSTLTSQDEVDQLMGVTKAAPALPVTSQTSQSRSTRPAILDWVFTCFDTRTGGFGGNVAHDGHLLYTLSALQIIALADAMNDERLNVEAVTTFVASLQQPDGSFCGDEWGEVDTRFTYCALSSLSILHQLDRVNVKQAARYIAKCRNLDGGFGCVIGAESHAGQVFCCIGALAIAQSLHLLNDTNDDHSNSDADLLGWWLAERQCDSGGLNGRPEKQADVCYSWWILSSLSILGRVSWISGDKLARFILKCQDEQDGGIADRPEDVADVFHTFFGIAGLSLLGHLHNAPLPNTSIRTSDNQPDTDIASCSTAYRAIDPVYALPADVVERLGLQAQVVGRRGEPIDGRLQRYTVLYVD